MDVLNARALHGAKYFLICIGLPAVALNYCDRCDIPVIDALYIAS
jgi:hypothetical protein